MKLHKRFLLGLKLDLETLNNFLLVDDLVPCAFQEAIRFVPGLLHFVDFRRDILQHTLVLLGVVRTNLQGAHLLRRVDFLLLQVFNFQLQKRLLSRALIIQVAKSLDLLIFCFNFNAVVLP